MKPLILKLDIKQNSYDTLVLQQGYDYTAEAYINDNGEVMDLTGATAQIQLLKASNTHIIETANINISGNKISFTLKNTFTNKFGQAKLQIVLTKDGLKFGSWVVKCDIRQGAITDDSIEDSLIIPVIEELQDKITEAEAKKQETEQLIATGNAVTKAELDKTNASLESNTNMINHVNNFENKVIQIAHRGYSVVAPENTLASFEMACLNGFDAVEIDAIFTSDNEIVIMHDDTIDRTTDGTGRVDEMTLTQLKSFNIDFGNELGMYDTQKIPTLDECLELFSKYKKTPCIEIKGLNTVERFNIFMNKLKKYGFSTQKNVIVIGGYDTLLQFKNTGVQLGIVCTNVTNDIVNQAYELNAFVDFGGFEQDTNVLNYAREKKVMLGSWTPTNSWTNYQKAISLGVKFFTTDKPLIVDKATEININNKDILTKIQSRSGITITDDINASGDYLVTFNNRGNFELKKNTSALNYLMFFITNLNKGDIVELSCDYKVKNSELINFGAGFLSSDGINGSYKVINSEMVTKTYTEQFVGWNSFKINTMYTGKDYDSKTLRLHFGVFDGLGDVEVKNLKINLSNNNAKIYGLSTTNTVSYTETVSTVITKTADGWTENNNLGNTITVVDANTLRLDFKTPFPSTTGVNYTGIVTVDYDHLYHCRINFASRTSIAFRFFSSTNANMTLDTVGIGTKVFITWFGANKTIII